MQETQIKRDYKIAIFEPYFNPGLKTYSHEKIKTTYDISDNQKFDYLLNI